MDFPGGPVVKAWPSNIGYEGSVPGWGANIPHALQSKKSKLKAEAILQLIQQRHYKWSTLKKKKKKKYQHGRLIGKTTIWPRTQRQFINSKVIPFCCPACMLVCMLSHSVCSPESHLIVSKWWEIHTHKKKKMLKNTKSLKSGGGVGWVKRVHIFDVLFVKKIK